MKKFYFSLAILAISILYLFLRLHNLSQNLEFRYDQGLHLLESYQMVQNRQIRLLGPAVTSKTYHDRQFFIGPYYYYVLAGLGVLSHWNPLSITQILIIVDFLVFLLFTFFIKQRFGLKPALIVAFVLCLSSYLIYHQRFIWNPHFLLSLSFIEIYFFDKFIRKHQLIDVYICFLIWGAAFSFHYAAIFWGMFLAIIILKNYKKIRFINYPLFVLAFVIGDLPYFVFELRHNFYNIRTILLTFFTNNQTSGFSSHYIIFPLLAFIIYFLLLLSQRYHRPIYLLLLLFLLLKPEAELDAVAGWQYPQMQLVKNMILKNCPSNYNIASTLTGDTRNYNLRFLLASAGCSPLPVESYPNASTIFLVAPPSRPPDTETVWEISSFKPFTVKSMVKLNNQVILYRLDKTHASNPKNN